MGSQAYTGNKDTLGQGCHNPFLPCHLFVLASCEEAQELALHSPLGNCKQRVQNTSEVGGRVRPDRQAGATGTHSDFTNKKEIDQRKAMIALSTFEITLFIKIVSLEAVLFILPSLVSFFLFHEVGIIMVPTSQDCWNDYVS